jgi:chromosome segregation ATPase
VYVIHTRRGHERPIHIGLGLSFRFNPYTDAFLIIPSAVQTLLINANCICIERQGILVQAYVQWIIDDIETAYKKLDFSDPQDPMHLVNVQLREQAEAAIKDKVATMSIDEVLSDKQPIIEELTHRLRRVAEGHETASGSDTASRDTPSPAGGSVRPSADGGLGLKIVTVQIKEAVVSSARLWENLQRPFRAERERLARLAQLESQRQIAQRELENRMAGETEELEAESRLAALRAEQERAKYDREQAEQVRRARMEQEADRQAIAEQNTTAKIRNEAALELALQELELERRRVAAEVKKIQAQMERDAAQAEQTRVQVAAALDVQELRNLAAATQVERELEHARIRRDIENTLSPAHVQAQMIERLPEIAERLPTPEALRTTVISSGEEDPIASPLLRFVAGMLSLTEDVVKSRFSEHTPHSNDDSVGERS